jgi:hypothetical protein
MPSPSRVTNPTLTRSFKFKFQKMYVEKIARPRSVAALKAIRIRVRVHMRV